MKIAVIGAGGVGGYFGARLMDAGHEVFFVARGGHLEALRSHGLVVEGAAGDLALRRVNATRDPSAIGPCDIVVLAVRCFGDEAAAAVIGPLLGPDTLVLTLQNGIDAPHRLARRLGARRVLGGGAYIAARIAGPGLIHVASPRVVLELAPVSGVLTPLAAEFVDVGNAAGFEVTVGTNVDVVLWRKLCLTSAFTGISCLYRADIGALRDDPVSFGLLAAAVAEAVAVGRAAGVALGEGAEAAAMEAFAIMPADLRSSMLDDLEHGRPLEVMVLSGTVVRLAAALGVAAPVHASIVDRLEGHIRGKPLALLAPAGQD
ncbi:ketopantoate reductase family protein [Zavarzinia aquatilis]|uniref:2-dehydropantoate 2-reductase n=1 Tax=Zavarzinia aquatilis TaxID=2211142 RepID=A0A317DVY2_9PROT|nr:2-dehydropantoate 2-reductase [Zavarzinia aquatilis]PWR18524.1 2-dehydropantoate 2-reductase [Zavarzinia aquatilis]